MTNSVADDRSTSPDSLGTFLARHALPGSIATCLIALGALGVGWLPLNSNLVEQPLVDALRGSTPGVLASRGLIFVGVALLLQAWIVLGYDLMAGAACSLGRAQAVIAAWTAPLILAPPLFSRDVYSYFAQGKLMIAGYDPYRTGVSVIPGWFQDGVDPMWGEAPTPYGPLFLLIERGVAMVSTAQPFLAAILFRLVALVGVLLLVAYVPRLAYAHGIDPVKALWIGVMNPLIVMHFIAGAHNDALMTGLMVMGLCLASERKPVVGIACIALAASVKPIALLALPFAGLLWAGTHAGWWRRIGAWAATLGVAAVTFGATALLAGVSLGWINALSTPGTVRTWLSPITALGMSIGWLTTVTGLTPSDDLAVGILRAIGTVAALAVVALLLLRPSGRSPVRGAALAFFAVVLLGPVIQPWYLLWFLPLFAATGLSRRELRWTILLTAMFVIHGMSESSATSDNLLEVTDGLAIMTAAAIIGIVLLASPRERRLVMGEPLSHGILPETPVAADRARAMVFQGSPA